MEFGELLNQLLIDLQSLFRESFKKNKITLSQITLITSIPLIGLDMTSLSKKIGVDNSTLTRLIDLLVKKNLLDRVNNPNDGRSKLILLTSKGMKLKHEVENKIEKIGKDICKNKNLDKYDQSKDFLNALHWEINKAKLK